MNRLAAEIKHLNQPPSPAYAMANPFKKPKRRYHLSKRGRAALRAGTQKDRPWEHSTGPRTAEGKAVTGQNNLKHGYYCRNPVFDDAAAFRAFVRSLNRQGKKPASRFVGPPVGEE